MEASGLKALDLALVDLGKKAAGKVARKSLRAGAVPIRDQAQANAPVKTGRGRRSIRIRAGKSKPGLMSVVIGTSKKSFQGDQFYMGFQEFGYHLGRRKLGDSRKKIAGKHFIERAYQQKGQTAIDVTIQTLKQGIEDVGQKE